MRPPSTARATQLAAILSAIVAAGATERRRDEMAGTEALEARRQRAREAFEETWTGTAATASDAIDAAIETATRVRITPEMIREAYPAVTVPSALAKQRLRAAFEAAGFEVEL